MTISKQPELTNTIIKKAEPGVKDIYDRGDTKSVTGLHLRVKPSGVKSFFLYYVTRQGIKRRPKLGDYPACTLEEARKRAKLLLGQVAVGGDPKGQWDLEKAEPLLDEIFGECFASYWSKERFKDSGWAREVQSNYNNHLKTRFGRLRISELTVPKIQSWLDGYSDHPVAGNRSLEVLSKLYNFALRKGYTERPNPCANVESFPEKKRERFASAEELKLLSEILKREYAVYPKQVTFVYLLMLTGARPSVIKKGKIEDLILLSDGSAKLVMAGKSSARTGKSETTIIPAAGVELIKKLGSLDTLTGTKIPHRFWSKVCKEGGFKDLWLRDLRRTFATIGLSNGVGISQIGELLNHKSDQTTKIYAKLTTEGRLANANLISQKIETMVGGFNG